MGVTLIQPTLEIQVKRVSALMLQIVFFSYDILQKHEQVHNVFSQVHKPNFYKEQWYLIAFVI